MISLDHKTYVGNHYYCARRRRSVTMGKTANLRKALDVFHKMPRLGRLPTPQERQRENERRVWGKYVTDFGLNCDYQLLKLIRVISAGRHYQSNWITNNNKHKRSESCPKEKRFLCPKRADSIISLQSTNPWLKGREYLIFHRSHSQQTRKKNQWRRQQSIRKAFPTEQ